MDAIVQKRSYEMNVDRKFLHVLMDLFNRRFFLLCLYMFGFL